ncbi:MAG: response regulator transcription factor [Xanthomonadales bacterium]|nr:response regulator transcription factor [Xanthomonadales bacterium]
MKAVRLAVADDQPLVRRGLVSMLNADDRFEVVVEAGDGEALMEALLESPVDLVLCDIRMPRLDGIEFVNRLRRGANPLPVILLTTFDDEGQLARAVKAGANGYLLKDAEPEELADAILRVHGGEKVLAPQPTAGLRDHSSLPPPQAPLGEIDERERALLRLMAAGLSNREIGERLHLAEGTVKNRVSVILSKLDARDRTQAVLKAITGGLI